jgi:hypothetical protein
LGDEAQHLRDLLRSQNIWLAVFLKELSAMYNGKIALYNGKRGSFLQSITPFSAKHNVKKIEATTEKNKPPSTPRAPRKKKLYPNNLENWFFALSKA